MSAIADDAPRLLHVRSELGYTDRVDLALVDEPEAVSPDYQSYLTREAARVRHDRDLEVWRSSRLIVADELDRLDATRFERDVSSDLRVLRRTLERIDRLLA